MSIPSNGQYTIFNAKFTTQDVDLLLGNPTSTIGGVVNNDRSMYMVWNFNTADSTTTPNFTLTNTATTAKGAYTSVDRTATGAVLHGSSQETIWTLLPTSQSGQYQIQAASLDLCASINLVWSLTSGDNGAPITLEPIAQNDLSQIWTFKSASAAQTGGNVARGINDLD